MGKAPKAPNPVTTANAQTASNVQTALANAQLANVNQVDAQGNSLTYTSTPGAGGIPQYTATQRLGAAGQQLLNSSQATQQNLANLAQSQSGRLNGLLSQNLDFSSLPQGGNFQNKDYSQDRQRVEDGLFSRLNPQIDRQRQQLEQDLVNRGIRPGSSAYSMQQQDFNQGVNDQRTSILLQGGQEQSRMQNMDLNAFGAQNTQRQNALNEMLTQRQTPINEILALAGGSQLQQPGFTNTPQTQMAGTDVAGITNQGYANQMTQHNSNQAMLGGLFNAGANLLMLSDRRAKQDIERIGQTDGGTPIYKFRYKTGGPVQIGYMAQDLLESQRDAVSLGPDGFYRVQYEKVS